MSKSRTIFLVLAAMSLIMLDGARRAKADAARGQSLSEQLCSRCHAIQPNKASANPKAPPFPTIAAEPSITGTSLQVFLQTPHSSMPNIMLKRDDKDDVIDYLLSLKQRQ